MAGRAAGICPGEDGGGGVGFPLKVLKGRWRLNRGPGDCQHRHYTILDRKIYILQ